MANTDASVAGISVLIAEDDRFLRKILTAKFTAAGFVVHGASDGQEALVQALEKHPTFILLDLILPKINGFEVLADLKTDKRTQNIPVIVLSNLGQEQDIARAKDLGAIDFLVKSNHSMEEIVGLVKEAYAKFVAKK